MYGLTPDEDKGLIFSREASFFRRNAVRLGHLLKKPNRAVRVKRFFRYRNAQRLLRMAEKEMRLQATHVHTRPVYMNLDTGPLCNLQCRFCCTANGIGKLKRELLKPETFERIVSNLPLDSLYEVSLFNWGEPLLNPNLNAYIQFFAEKGIWVVIHTNFSTCDYGEAFMETLIRTGIGDVTVSVDGATQENYEKYRIGGDLRRVIANIGRLARAKRRLNSDTPIITYKMMINRYNQHEVEDARSIAESLGVEFLLQTIMGTPDAQSRAEWTASEVFEQYGDMPVSSVDMNADAPVITECRQMWDSLVVNADGAVFPCCLVCTPGEVVGNLTTQRFEDIWNGEKMRALRQYALDSNAASPAFPNACVGCLFRNCAYREKRQLSKSGP